MTKRNFMNKLDEMLHNVKSLQLALYEDSTPIMEVNDMITIENDFNAIEDEIMHAKRFIALAMEDKQ